MHDTHQQNKDKEAGDDFIDQNEEEAEDEDEEEEIYLEEEGEESPSVSDTFSGNRVVGKQIRQVKGLIRKTQKEFIDYTLLQDSNINELKD